VPKILSPSLFQFRIIDFKELDIKREIGHGAFGVCFLAEWRGVLCVCMCCVAVSVSEVLVRVCVLVHV